MKFFTTVLPSMLVGGVLFGSAFSSADSGRHYASPNDPTIVAQVDPRPVPNPHPVAPPAPPAPPAPAKGKGFSFSMHDGKVTIDGVDGLVDSSIREAEDAIRTSGLPGEVRDKLLKRLDNVRTKVKNRVAHIDVKDLDQLGDEMNKMGDDIGKEMDEFGKEMEKYGEKWGKNFQKNWKGPKIHVDFDSDSDSDDDNDVQSSVDVDDQDDLDEAVRSLGDLSLKGPQRDQIQKLRADSDRQVATAKKALDQASDALKRTIDNTGSSDADISRAIDAVTQQEAAIRKARILAWHNARRVLDDAQRKRVEDAAGKGKHK